MDETTKTGLDADDLPAEDIEARRKRSRINALALLLIFVLAVVLPYPWNSYAPLLILIPAVYVLVTRLRKSRRQPTSPGQNGSHNAGSADIEPYAGKPVDKGDPRKYRPIG